MSATSLVCLSLSLAQFPPVDVLPSALMGHMGAVDVMMDYKTQVAYSGARNGCMLVVQWCLGK